MLIVSADPVAADLYAAEIMAEHNPKFTVESVMTKLKRAEELGLGKASLDQVEIMKTAA